jgi:hypothetical protein
LALRFSGAAAGVTIARGVVGMRDDCPRKGLSPMVKSKVWCQGLVGGPGGRLIRTDRRPRAVVQKDRRFGAGRVERNTVGTKLIADELVSHTPSFNSLGVETQGLAAIGALWRRYAGESAHGILQTEIIQMSVPLIWSPPTRSTFKPKESASACSISLHLRQPMCVVLQGV